MRAKPVNADEQYRLIMECRASGLTDYQWCIEHGIKPGTFYNWVKRLRQKGCDSIPSAVKSRAPVRQEIVKIDLQKPSGSILEIEAPSEPVSRSSSMLSELPLLEMSMAGIKIIIKNGTDIVFLEHLLMLLRRTLC